jgi:hypothetical protein
VKISLVVLAAGLGTRFQGDKVLADVGPDGEALLDYSLYDAFRCGATNAVLVIRQAQAATVRQHLDRIVGDRLPITLVFQDATPLPAGRVKPWGTGHATLVAGATVGGGCVVINGDDFYGRRAIAAAVQHLQATADRMPREHALIGFRLDQTAMSAVGGVSRAVLTVDEDGGFRDVTEIRDIVRGADGFRGRAEDGAERVLSGSELVSMNLWALHRDIFPGLEQAFRRFLADSPAADSEFLLAPGVREAVSLTSGRVRIIEGEGGGIGITWPQDGPAATIALQELAADGEYPTPLRQGFRALVRP